MMHDRDDAVFFSVDRLVNSVQSLVTIPSLGRDVVIINKITGSQMQQNIGSHLVITSNYQKRSHRIV